MKKISAVIFDCDGVMFESRQANINFYNHILDHFGQPPMSPEDLDFVHVSTAGEAVSHIFRNTSLTAAAEEYRLAAGEPDLPAAPAGARGSMKCESPSRVK